MRVITTISVTVDTGGPNSTTELVIQDTLRDDSGNPAWIADTFTGNAETLKGKVRALLVSRYGDTPRNL